LNTCKNQKLSGKQVYVMGSSKERFVVFVAGGKHPVIRFENFSRAESLAVSFAGLLNMRMEVFDSVKETCYFIEPAEAKGSNAF
jgi:hypothetical protein